jgi:ABC-2 type transport system permease protein
VAGLNPETRTQLAAITRLRWQLFFNSLRTTRGKLELFSRFAMGLIFVVGGLGGGTLMGVGAHAFVAEGKAPFLAFLLWPVFFFWQFFPVMATAFTNNPDSSGLLRFPLSYRSYFLVRLAYGSFDAATFLGSMWLLGISAGIGIARPSLLPWAALVLLTFAAVNLLIQQMVFAWVERWLAQRRTREIMGVLFFLLMLSFQLIGPLTSRFSRHTNPDAKRILLQLEPVQRSLPPGLAANAIAQAGFGSRLSALGSFLALCVFAFAIAGLLHLRLLKQFRGENLNEAPRAAAPSKNRQLSLGWSLPGFSGTISTTFEKEIRYLLRSGPMLFTLIMPVFTLVLFRLGPMHSLSHSGFGGRSAGFAFPAAAAYSLLMLTNLAYNNFGGDAGGIQFFFASPVRFREIVLAKNLAHAAILLLEISVSWIAVVYLYGLPAPAIAFATLAGLLFAAPVNFAVGNLLSLYSPKKLDYSTFGRQRASQTTVFASMGVQVVVIGLSAAVLGLARLYGNLWIATPVFLLLASVSISAHVRVLNGIDGIALIRRETLVSELCRA